MGMPGIPELIVIFLIVLFVFGAGKIPAIAKDLGSAIKVFKKTLNGESFDNNETKQSIVKELGSGIREIKKALNDVSDK